jgi:hypothetical protein
MLFRHIMTPARFRSIAGGDPNGPIPAITIALLQRFSC